MVGIGFLDEFNNVCVADDDVKVLAEKGFNVLKTHSILASVKIEENR